MQNCKIFKKDIKLLVVVCDFINLSNIISSEYYAMVFLLSFKINKALSPNNHLDAPSPKSITPKFNYDTQPKQKRGDK
jgi:hypothetical protein